MVCFPGAVVVATPVFVGVEVVALALTIATAVVAVVGVEVVAMPSSLADAVVSVFVAAAVVATTGSQQSDVVHVPVAHVMLRSDLS